MPERSRIHSSEESMRSQISSLVTTRDGPVAADARGSGRRSAPLGALMRALMQCTASGCSRMIGWPGATGSPSSTSHSTTVPPCGATTGCSSREVTRVPTAAPGSSVVPIRQVGDADGALGWARPASARSASRPCGDALPCRATRSRAASRSAGVFSATVSTPGSARLISPVRVPAGGTSITPVTPSSAIVLHAQVPAHRVADLGDDPLAAPRGPVAAPRRRRGWRSARCAGRAR